LTETPPDTLPDASDIRVEFPLAGYPGVALVTIDRPAARNALSFQVLADLATALQTLDESSDCHAVVLTGAGDRAFAAGADILELAEQTPARLAGEGHFSSWDSIAAVGIPLVAAVRGHALGGGCELALICDVIVAGDDARFGQPEITIGVMPGAGGTQRLVRAIGPALAMDVILSGRVLDAQVALSAGLVSRVVPAADTVPEALALAARIAAMPPLAVRAAKRAVLTAFEQPLSEGLQTERAAFFALFATQDQREGMRAFIQKRPPVWTGR
jgi:enoyl-CoA hydratase